MPPKARRGGEPRCAVRADRGQLCGADAGMLLRIVAEPASPARRPNDSQNGENPIDRSPPPARHQRDGDPRRHGETDTAAEHDDGLRARPLARRKPVGDRRGAARKRSGFAAPEQKTNRDQAGQVPRRAGQRRKGRPPDHDARQQRSGAEPVGEETAGYLEQHVAEHEERPRASQLLVGQAQLVGHRPGSGAEADAVHISDRHQDEHEPQNPVARRHV